MSFILLGEWPKGKLINLQYPNKCKIIILEIRIKTINIIIMNKNKNKKDVLQQKNNKNKNNIITYEEMDIKQLQEIYEQKSKEISE